MAKQLQPAIRRSRVRTTLTYRKVTLTSTAGDCPTKAGLNQAQYEVDFTQPGGLEAAMANWTMTSGNASSTSNGAEFSIDELGQAPTMQSNFYVFFGLIEVTMQAAPGTGIVSSVVLESDDLDEIDWVCFQHSVISKIANPK